MLALALLRFGLIAIGLAALAIGTSMFLLGPALTGAFFGGLLAAVAGTPQAVDDLAAVNVDTELRFYSVFWIAYGGCLIAVARALAERIAQARLLLAVFFAGGVGRVLSYAIAGAPHPLFVVLMWVELALPPVLMALSFVPRRK